ncbi:hypothetical protein A3Q56_01492 [Intoshia linei]|uniref:Uncharacterized protein n=1 Tax=Intoshia linei TaxID=1819745 RepID=A0A177BAU1_9BILA|nr:hypothetical protein A3Q56_01492 [Intoshia linei]
MQNKIRDDLYMSSWLKPSPIQNIDELIKNEGNDSRNSFNQDSLWNKHAKNKEYYGNVSPDFHKNWNQHKNRNYKKSNVWNCQFSDIKKNGYNCNSPFSLDRKGNFIKEKNIYTKHTLNSGVRSEFYAGNFKSNYQLFDNNQKPDVSSKCSTWRYKFTQFDSDNNLDGYDLRNLNIDNGPFYLNNNFTPPEMSPIENSETPQCQTLPDETTTTYPNDQYSTDSEMKLLVSMGWNENEEPYTITEEDITIFQSKIKGKKFLKCVNGDVKRLPAFNDIKKEKIEVAKMLITSPDKMYSATYEFSTNAYSHISNECIIKRLKELSEKE